MAKTHTVTPDSLDFRAGKLVVRVGKGEDQTILYNGETLTVEKMAIDIDYSRGWDGGPLVAMTIIP